ncbi:alpha/beta hydrolase [Streptomyces sp. NPDC046821]|uniref:alpha/beta hydrolase n=1 Tax=Streptomyces sp. NPDC046821 TaxID=3154702 RepID=UPI0033E1B956
MTHATDLTLSAVHNPDGQPPLPVDAAVGYARTVMDWDAQGTDPAVGAARDIAYGPHPLHRYNVFAPQGAERAPVLVFWHGGGWTNGYRQWVTFMSRAACSLGFVLVAPSYRLAPAHPLPAGLEDALAALAHIRHGIRGWGGDPHRLFLAGHSAGGQLAALTALLAPEGVAACLPVSGIMDLRHPAPLPGSLEELIYTTVLAEPALDTAMSPVCRITEPGAVPFLLTYGEHDTDRVIRSNQTLAAQLADHHTAVDLVEETGADHFHTHTALRSPDYPWYRRLAEMLRRSTT